MILDWSETAFLPPEQLRDMPKGVIAPTAKSLFVRLLRMQTGPESQLKCRARQLSISRVTDEPQHVLCLWWVLCKCKASVLNWSSDLLWKHFSFHILLTTGFKCFVLAPVNRGKRQTKSWSRTYVTKNSTVVRVFPVNVAWLETESRDEDVYWSHLLTPAPASPTSNIFSVIW